MTYEGREDADEGRAEADKEGISKNDIERRNAKKLLYYPFHINRCTSIVSKAITIIMPIRK